MQPVTLALESGFTYGGPNGDAFNLNSAVAGTMRDATVQGYELVLRSRISRGAISRSLNGKAAFENATKYVVANMLKSMTRRLEMQLMYGQKEIAVVDSVVVGASGTITIDAKSFAPAFWTGAKNTVLEIFSADGLTQRGADHIITGIDFATKTITINNVDADVVATDIIYFKGAKGNEFKGLDAIITETTDLFGINPSSFELWKGNVLTLGAVLTLDVIENAVALAVEKGLTEQDVCCMVNVNIWSDLLKEENARRRYDGSHSSEKLENGTQELVFYGQNGMIKIVPSIYVKQGDAFIVPMDELMRIGSTDVTFKDPASDAFGGDKYFFPLENAMGYELRAYTDQALFCACPAKLVKITDINKA